MLTPLPPYQAVLIKTGDSKVMVIADLHIGWEIALSQAGIHVPSQTSKLLTKLEFLLREYKPTELVILGDVKHTVAKAEIGEWRDIPDFFNGLKNLVDKILIIRGNHDGNLEPLLPENVRLLASAGEVISNVAFFHGHQWPSARLLECRTLVMGHAHPVVTLRDPAGFRIMRQVWVRANCDSSLLTKILERRHKVINNGALQTASDVRAVNKPNNTELFIMPSFNDFLGGRSLNERSRVSDKGTIGPLLRSNAVDLENAEIYLLDGSFLGSLTQLKALG
jgi:putative SbcD/Mre11-related phosphoesterase